MSFGSRSYGGNTFGGLRPMIRYDITVDPIAESINITEHLNIKYRKILTNLWSREGRQSSHSYLLAALGEYLLQSDDGKIYISSSNFGRQTRQNSNWTEEVKQNSSWNKLDRNE
jgi:hypothetical protein